MDYQDICSQVCATARKAGEFIATERLGFTRDMVELKGKQDFVSYVDKQAEQIIAEQLRAIVPRAGMIGEEGTQEQHSADIAAGEYVWIVDPLDGTTNFIHGMPPYCVSIALMCGNRVVVGVVYEITIGECFYTWHGAAGAYMNGQQICSSSEYRLEASLVVTGLASNNTDGIRERFSALFDYFNGHCHGARRLGSAAADLVYVAAGRAECFYHVNLSPWDVAAGAFIVQQAGGRVTDFDGGDNYIFGRSIIASNGLLHNEFSDIIAK